MFLRTYEYVYHRSECNIMLIYYSQNENQNNLLMMNRRNFCKNLKLKLYENDKFVRNNETY